MPRVTRRRTKSGRFAKSAPRRRRTVVVNPRRRRARRTYAPVYARNPRKRRVSSRRRYRRNPGELMELGALMANPRMSQRAKEYAEAMYRTGMSPTAVAKSLRHAPGTITRYLKKRRVYKGRRRSYKPRKKTAKKHTSTKKHHRYHKKSRASRVLRFHVPKGRRVGKVRVEFNPRFSWMQLKESAKSGVYAVAGFAAASMLTSLISSKLGASLAIGPMKSPSIVATLIAALLPFIPLQFPGKEMVVAGAFTHAFSRLIRDAIPQTAGIQGHLPGTMGEFAQLMSMGAYANQGLPDFTSRTGMNYDNAYMSGLSMYQDNRGLSTYQQEPVIGDPNSDPNGLGLYPDNMFGAYPDEQGF